MGGWACVDLCRSRGCAWVWNVSWSPFIHVCVCACVRVRACVSWQGHICKHACVDMLQRSMSCLTCYLCGNLCFCNCFFWAAGISLGEAAGRGSCGLGGHVEGQGDTEAMIFFHDSCFSMSTYSHLFHAYACMHTWYLCNTHKHTHTHTHTNTHTCAHTHTHTHLLSCRLGNCSERGVGGFTEMDGCKRI